MDKQTDKALPHRRRKLTRVEEPLTIQTVVAHAEAALVDARAFLDSVHPKNTAVKLLIDLEKSEMPRKKTDSASMEAPGCALQRVHRSSAAEPEPQQRNVRVMPEPRDTTALDSLVIMHREFNEARKIIHRFTEQTLIDFIAGRLDTTGHQVELVDQIAAAGYKRKILIVDGVVHPPAF